MFWYIQQILHVVSKIGFHCKIYAAASFAVMLLLSGFCHVPWSLMLAYHLWTILCLYKYNWRPPWGRDRITSNHGFNKTNNKRISEDQMAMFPTLQKHMEELRQKSREDRQKNEERYVSSKSKPKNWDDS